MTLAYTCANPCARFQRILAGRAVELPAVAPSGWINLVAGDDAAPVKTVEGCLFLRDAVAEFSVGVLMPSIFQ
jgi:hypothetical protein